MSYERQWQVNKVYVYGLENKLNELSKSGWQIFTILTTTDGSAANMEHCEIVSYK